MTMLRKVTLGLIAAASLGAAALAPSAASAGGFYHPHWGHHGWGHHGYALGFGPSLYINTGYNNCYQQRMVETRRGLRLRTVNVCAYGY
jgi:hypothetical protein